MKHNLHIHMEKTYAVEQYWPGYLGTLKVEVNATIGPVRIVSTLFFEIIDDEGAEVVVIPNGPLKLAIGKQHVFVEGFKSQQLPEKEARELVEKRIQHIIADMAWTDPQ